jgi:hypothetical protein
MSKLYTHKEFGGLYDWDGKNLTAVLKLYEGGCDNPIYKRFNYEMYEGYIKAKKKDIRKYRLGYYNDIGERCLYKYNVKNKVSKYYKNFFNSLKETNLKIATKESITNRTRDNKRSEDFDILIDYIPNSCDDVRFIEDKEFKIVDFDVEKVKYEVLEQL